MAGTQKVSELIFDKYEIQHRLAVGGMGEVFYAVQKGAVRGFERPVILKNLLPDLAQQEGFIEQFLDEARVAATLNHPNVVSIYEVGLWNGVYFIAMEFIRGRNISQLIRASLKKELPIPPAVSARIVHDAALGLDHAHVAKDGAGKALNIVHRDISPQNIMVRDDGVTKVVDFGIARASNRATRTATGAVKGKLAYMAPEQLQSREITGLADQFALGIVLWEMCTRRRLFQSEREIDLVKLVMNAPIQRPSTLVAGLPEELDDIALRMLERNPAGRYANAAEVARALEGFLVKFSPPSSESPVAAFMRQLGFDEAGIAPRATPSNQNFVISLKTSHPPVPTVASPGSAAPVRESRRGRAVGIAFAVSALLAASGVAAWKLVNGEAPFETPPPPVQPVVEAPKPPPVVEPQPVAPDPAPPPLPAARAKLTVASIPSGAYLRLNGRKSGETPQTLELEPGEAVHLQLDKPGWLPLESDATLAAGEVKRLDLKLVKRQGGAQPVPPVAVPAPLPLTPAEPGFISIATEPWTKVSVDGDPFGSTPIFKKRLAAGKHTVVLETESGLKATRSVEIRPGETTKLQLAVK